MADKPRWTTHSDDLKILRSLAQRMRDIAESPVNRERRETWHRHNDLQPSRPVILFESHVALDDLVPGSVLQCREGWARGIEHGFRRTIYHHEHIRDDAVVEPYMNCNWHVGSTGYGVTIEKVRGKHEVLGSYRWDPPIADIVRDFDKLKPRAFSVDRDATLAWKEHLETVFDGVLPVRLRGGFWWTVGMTWVAIDLIGLENLMLYMYDEPEGLHRLMAFLRDDHIAFAEWLEREGLLSLNNENDYIGSGSRGYTKELPSAGWRGSGSVRLRDLWALSESQETVGVGPSQFAEFIFPYQLAVVEKFGFVYYGCCEPVHDRWESLRKFPNLRSVSVSPWCDQEFMASALGRDYVFSRKPNPTLISTERFDENAILADLRHTVDVAKNCNLELVMKDVHTLAGEPQRAERWVSLARRAVAEVWG